MRKKVGIIKRVLCIGLVFLLSINSFAAIVSDNDGSAFITKAEFDALKATFQTQIDSYNNSIDSKIDGAIASYLAGIKLSTLEDLELDYWVWEFPIKKLKNDEIFNCENVAYGSPKILLERFAMAQTSSGLTEDTYGVKFDETVPTKLRKTVQLTTTSFNKVFYQIGALKNTQYSWDMIPYEHYSLDSTLSGGNYVCTSSAFGYYDYNYRTKNGEQGWVGNTDKFDLKVVTDGSTPVVQSDRVSYISGYAGSASSTTTPVGSGFNIVQAYAYRTMGMDNVPDFSDPSLWDLTQNPYQNWVTICDLAKGSKTRSNASVSATNLGLYSGNFITQDTKRRYIYDGDAYLYANQEDHDGWKISIDSAEWMKFNNANNPYLTVNLYDAWTFAYNFYNTSATPIWDVYAVPTNVISTTNLSGPWFPLKEEDKSSNSDNFSAVKAKKVIYKDKGGTVHNMGEGLYMLKASDNGTLNFKIKFGNANGAGALSGKLKIAKKGFNETLATGDIYDLTINTTTAKEQSIETGIEYEVKVEGVKKNEQLFLMWYEDTTGTNIQIEEIKEIVLMKEN